ncbi:MAG: MASE2 domain-containing protein, partial [Marinobacter sp.]|uniref:MASE2 domain-containing protein n=1 Tax=Marinobacter sp. TaxID=50741 RepID=UPI00299F07FC
MSKSLITDGQSTPVAIPPMPDYNGRILAYVATGAVIVAGLLEGVFPGWMVWLVAGALIWPHVVHFLTRRTFLRFSPRIRQKMLLCDCIVGGAFI